MGANLKEVRDRIKSVISTQQITKAMKMVSAAKLRRAQQAIVQLRPYSIKLNEILSNILENVDAQSGHKWDVARVVNNPCVVIVTSNRGLAGAFNTNITKLFSTHILSNFKSQLDRGQLTIVPIGKRGADFTRKNFPKANIILEHVNAFSDLSFNQIGKISLALMNDFGLGKYDSVDIVYSIYKNAAMQFPEVEQFLPIPKLKQSDLPKSKIKADYLFEPVKEKLLEALIPMILRTQFQKTLLDTHASEHGARMTAMDKATENAEAILLDMKITYNKARQEAITKELSEIVGGAAALQ